MKKKSKVAVVGKSRRLSWRLSRGYAVFQSVTAGRLGERVGGFSLLACGRLRETSRGKSGWGGGERAECEWQLGALCQSRTQAQPTLPQTSPSSPSSHTRSPDLRPCLRSGKSIFLCGGKGKRKKKKRVSSSMR